MYDAIEYHFDNVESFHAELDDILKHPYTHDQDVCQTSSRYVNFLSRYYVLFPQDVTTAFYKLIDSSLFLNNSTTVLSWILECSLRSPPNDAYIPYGLLLYAGRDEPKWMEYIVFDAIRNGSNRLLRKLVREISDAVIPQDPWRFIVLELIFEICKVRHMEKLDFGLLSADFIACLLDLVEQSSKDTDEKFMYDVIQVIIVLNEQFMMAKGTANCVLEALEKRPSTSYTLGSNVIFMLNRTNESCLQILLLKFLYGIFTRAELFEYFYTNDLYVLVDISLRQILDLGDKGCAQALRDAYLRVLNPLLTNTQLRYQPYKSKEIYRVLMDVTHPYMTPVPDSTKRLAERILDLWRKSPLEDICASTPIAPSPRFANAMATSVAPVPNKARRDDKYLDIPPLPKA